MMESRRWFRICITATLAAATLAGCGGNNTVRGGSIVANTSIGISYTIPNGYYQVKDESAAFGQVKDQSTTTPLVTLWKEGSYEAGKRPSINIQKATGPHSHATDNGGDNPEAEALWWAGYGSQDQTSHLRRISWDGPNLPGLEVSYQPMVNDTRTGCAVAVIGFPGDRILIEALGGSVGRTAYLPEVHDVALSVKLLPIR